VLHDLHLAARVADDVVMMRRGRVIATGTADEVLVAPLIRETYGIDAEVGRTADGTRFILPLTRAG
jgi:iron complex transport system ATP-binding protein